MPTGKQSAAETLQRQWALLRVIPREPVKATASDLQVRLRSDGHEVTLRTIQRDLDSLSRVFPLYADERSKPFGWTWKKDAPLLSVPGLSPSEALAFHLVQRYAKALLPTSLLQGLAPHFAAADRILKENATGNWTQRVRVVHPGQTLLPPAVDDRTYGALTEALLRDRQVKANYNGKTSVLHPLALVQRGPVSYLVATAFDYDEARLFAVQRFRDVEILPERVNRRGFDIDRYIEEGNFGFGGGGKIVLEAFFTRDAARHLRESMLSPDQVLTDEPDKRVRVKATVLDTPQLQWWLLGFGPSVEVLRPPSLRRKMAAAAAEMAEAYRK